MRKFPIISLRIAAAAAFLCSATSVWAQAHEARHGAYIVRSSTVASVNLSEATARKHGVERDPGRAVVNVTVLKRQGKDEVTVPARVEVKARNLTGLEREVPMRNTSVGGWHSYMGTYDFTHGEVVDFIVSAHPEGTGQAVTLTYRDRMWQAGKPMP